jgi:hypothetical protein
MPDFVCNIVRSSPSFRVNRRERLLGLAFGGECHFCEHPCLAVRNFCGSYGLCTRTRTRITEDQCALARNSKSFEVGMRVREWAQEREREGSREQLSSLTRGASLLLAIVGGLPSPHWAALLAELANARDRGPQHGS